MIVFAEEGRFRWFRHEEELQKTIDKWESWERWELEGINRAVEDAIKAGAAVAGERGQC